MTMVMTVWLIITEAQAATSATTNSTAPRLLQQTDTSPSAETHKENTGELYRSKMCGLNNKLVCEAN